jgi:hypothetical protein
VQVAEPVDTSATDPGDVYVVQENDNVWKIAGNDPQLVQWIYDHNPWLNERMKADRDPINRLLGQNPNYINAGELILLPPGYKPPTA